MSTLQVNRRKIGKTERNAIINAWGNKCAYCTQQETSFEIDHIVPHADGGACELENLCASCNSCNRRKRDMRLPKLYEGLLLSIAKKKAKKIRKNQFTSKKFWGADTPKSAEVAVFGIKHVKKYLLPKVKGNSQTVTQEHMIAHFEMITQIVAQRVTA